MQMGLHGIRWSIVSRHGSGGGVREGAKYVGQMGRHQR